MCIISIDTACLTAVYSYFNGMLIYVMSCPLRVPGKQDTLARKYFLFFLDGFVAAPLSLSLRS